MPDSLTMEEALDVDAISDWARSWLADEIARGVPARDAVAQLDAATPLIARAITAMRIADAARGRCRLFGSPQGAPVEKSRRDRFRDRRAAEKSQNVSSGDFDGSK